MQITKYICDDCLKTKDEKDIKELVVGDQHFHLCEFCVTKRLVTSLKYFEPEIKCPKCKGTNRIKGERLSFDNNDFSSVICDNPIHATLELRMLLMNEQSKKYIEKESK